MGPLRPPRAVLGVNDVALLGDVLLPRGQLIPLQAPHFRMLEVMYNFQRLDQGGMQGPHWSLSYWLHRNRGSRREPIVVARDRRQNRWEHWPS